MITDAALSGNMVAVVTAQMIENQVLEGKLVPIMTEFHLQDWGTFYAVYPHRDPPQKTKLFIGILKSIVGENIPVWEDRIPGFDAFCGRLS